MQDEMAASTQLQEELNENESIYYQGAGVEALKKWKKMSEEEKRQQQKGDDIDAISTSDLEQEVNWEDDIDDFYMELNKVNLARAFLGKDDGYSVRRLKKMMQRFKQAKQDEKDDKQKAYQDRRAAAALEEHDGDEATEKSVEAKVEGTENSESANKFEFSDESDLEAHLDNIPDEELDKMIEEFKA